MKAAAAGVGMHLAVQPESSWGRDAGGMAGAYLYVKEQAGIPRHGPLLVSNSLVHPLWLLVRCTRPSEELQRVQIPHVVHLQAPHPGHDRMTECRPAGQEIFLAQESLIPIVRKKTSCTLLLHWPLPRPTKMAGRPGRWHMEQICVRLPISPLTLAEHCPPASCITVVCPRTTGAAPR